MKPIDTETAIQLLRMWITCGSQCPMSIEEQAALGHVCGVASRVAKKQWEEQLRQAMDMVEKFERQNTQLLSHTTRLHETIEQLRERNNGPTKI